RKLLVENWGGQFQSHNVGTLRFGPDGMLYVGCGEGGNFNAVDYGNFGNPLGDPPTAGASLTAPTSMGGALRSQIIDPPAATPPFPKWFSGKIVRIDPNGAPMLDPRAVGVSPVVGYGLRNPFRFAFRPGTHELWIGDVGWNNVEEIDRIADAVAVTANPPNFGWPCYEGLASQPGYDGANLTVCENLYAAATAKQPVYNYSHYAKVLANDAAEPQGSSSISSVGFYSGTVYPALYQGALFFGDYARQSIWYAPAGAGGQPDFSQIGLFARGAGVVQVMTGPDGALWWVDIVANTINRATYAAGNSTPVAVIKTDVTGGQLPLTVHFDASDSTDADPNDTLSYAWDLDNDGAFNDGTGLTASWTYTVAQTTQARLRVTDPQSAQGIATITLHPGANPPVPTIIATGPTNWKAGDALSYTGTATDVEDGTLPPTSFVFSAVLHHCPISGCHEHFVQSQAEGTTFSFVAPAHEYPSYLEIRLSATDSSGLTGTASTTYQPITSTVTLTSNPPGLGLIMSGQQGLSPYALRFIVGSPASIAATTQVYQGTLYQFSSWSDGGASEHDLVVPAGNVNLTANFVQAAPSTTNVASMGSPIALVTAPTGQGNHSIEVIRDGIKPAVGSAVNTTQYDTYNGGAARAADWIGYTFPTQYAFSQVVFQEGMQFGDGGWFTNLTVQVRQNGVWNPVSNFASMPVYGGANGTSFDSYILTFATILGDGIRIFGAPGGASAFTSVGELEVYGVPAGGATNAAPVANAGPDATVTTGATVALTGTGSSDPDGNSLTYSWTQTGGPAVTLTGATTATPTFAAPAAATSLTFSLQVSDGSLTSSDTVVITVQAASTGGTNLAAMGTPVAFVMAPTGGGNQSIEVMRDGVKPALGTANSAQQYDTYNGGAPRASDWFGYTFASSYAFTKVVFEEGKQFVDGGWFTGPTVQVRQNGVWNTVTGLTTAPAYAGANGVNFDTFTFTFTATTGDGIRLFGAPGGSAAFTSVAELEVYGTAAGGTTNHAPVANAGPDATVTAGALAALSGTGSSDQDGDALTYLWTQTAGTPVSLTGATTAAPTFTAPAAPASLTFNLQVSDSTLTNSDSVVVTVQGAAGGGTNLASAGTPVAFVTAPTGGGSHNLETIRDGVKPAVATGDSAQQYDSYNGGAARASDWYGYTFASSYAFTKVVFEEGKQFVDGGWFTSLTVQVRQGGVWNAVAGVTTAPTYAGANGVNYDSYTLTFAATTGDGIRIFGTPAGSAAFTSVAELEVYGTPSAGGTNRAPLANAGPDATVTGATTVALTGTGSSDPDGDALTYQWTQTAGTAVTLTGANTASPTFTAPAAAGSLTFSLQVGDGSLTSTDAVVITVQAAPGATSNLASIGVPVALVTAPGGQGNHNLELMRDGVRPAAGATDVSQQYDTWNGGAARASDWYGYTFPSNHSFTKVVFQEGVQFGDGGWFTDLTVQVRQAGVWNAVAGATVVPAFAGANGVNFDSYTFTFPATSGDGIRVFGAPGGSAAFTSIAELEAYGQ
ncbi:MAG: sugar dehydrogenase, partial [Myxococcaceae bacterium]|nr:sugar dehydrogenase [Myxococcaceae bacterium]